MMTRVELHEAMFGPAWGSERRVLLSHGGITVQAFRFDSGVAAIEVDSGAARAVLLPYLGQQIWDLYAQGRRLTMQSVFDEPEAGKDYLGNYGAFLIHCGGTAMGNPSPDDDHSLHGELPALRYRQATLECGSDARGAYVTLTGEGHDRRAFGHHFVSRPRLRMTAGSARIDLDVAVQNWGGARMPFMYLAHVNFRPVAGGVIVDALRDDRAGLRIRPTDLPADADPDQRAWHDAVAADPASHRRIDAGTRIDPEVVMVMTLPTGLDGQTHGMQLHPDGTADFISYDKRDLPVAVRWITRGPERQALGLILPGTAAPDGRAAAQRAGQVIDLPPGGSFTTSMCFGALDADEAKKMAAGIADLRARA
jgi:hypothetical protein